MQTLEQTQQFSFQAQELSSKLLECTLASSNGYWTLQFSRLASRKETACGYLGITHAGTIGYSGYRPWSSHELLQVAKRYILQTRQDPLKAHVARWQSAVKEQQINPRAIYEHMLTLGIDPEQIQAALRLKLLNDFDSFVSFGAGEAQFVPDPQLQEELPIPGFPIAEILQAVQDRQILWQQLRPIIPSMQMLPVLDPDAIAAANLPQVQHQWIEKVVKHERPLSKIAIGLAKDPLEVARLFSKWVQAKLLRLEPLQQTQSTTVMIIDDSPLVLKQFHSLVGALGYRVEVCQQAETALEKIAQAKPSIIFIDINMPGLTGFELVKEIRQQPHLAGIPLVILTGEQKLSNKWRAQWSGCEFLTKPLAAAEINQFQLQLQELIHTLVFSPSLIAGA
ncbi:response regulator [Acaryochloris sp. IP29b_bin.137]|uniref:response regulator n=1 Tax=Acaryochloris sp. IP29b_bin.137 TaxID=2969217 RepID=UPI0026152F8D|nr:response regulator [Acaryochloris sp. IP29b_bin.137]